MKPFSFRNAESEYKGSGMTSLVDVFLSTIGIFVIIFALQEISVVSERVPASFDGALVCDNEGIYVIHGFRGNQERLDSNNLSFGVKNFAPGGGRFLVGIMPRCASTEIKKGVFATSLAFKMREELGLHTNASGEALYQFEIAPLDEKIVNFYNILKKIKPQN